MKHTLKKIVQIITIVFLSVILLLGITIGLLQTQMVKTKIAGTIEEKAPQFINGEVTVGKIHGNFLSKLGIENLLVTYQEDTVLYLDKIETSYNLWSLLSRKIDINTLKIQNPLANLSMNSDSVWNFQQLMKETEQDTTTSTFDYQIVVNHFKLEEGQINTEHPDTLIPRSIANLNIQAFLHYSTNNQQVHLQRFSLNTKSPDFGLQQLTFNLKRDTSNIVVEALKLKTAKNQLDGNAQVSPKDKLSGSAKINTEPIHLQEFDIFIPGITIPAHPEINIETKIENGTLNAQILITESEQKIEITATSANFIEFIGDTINHQLAYKLNGQLTKVNPGKWIRNDSLDYLINGSFNIDGQGTNPKNAAITATGNFNDSKMNGKVISLLTFNLKKEAQNLNASLKGEGEFGQINLEGEITQIFNRPDHSIRLSAQNFDLAPITNDDSLHSNINLTATLNGTGKTPQDLRTNAEIQVSQSTFQQLSIDTISSNISYHDQNITIDTLGVETDGINLNAAGNYNLRGISDLTVKGTIYHLNAIEYYLPNNQIQSNGTIVANLHGQPDSLEIKAEIKLDSTVFDSIYVGNISTNSTAKIYSQKTSIEGVIKANDISQGQSIQFADSINFNFFTNLDSVYADGTISHPVFNSKLKAGVSWSEAIDLTIDELQVELENQTWQLTSAPSRAIIDSTQYRIDNFTLVTDNDSTQSIEVDGFLKTDSISDLKIALVNINLKKVDELLPTPTKISGRFNYKMSVLGEASNPEITGNFNVDSTQFNEYEFEKLNGDFSVKNQIFNLTANIATLDSGNVDASIQQPVYLKLDSMNFALNERDSINYNVNVTKFPIDFIESFNFNQDISGNLNGQINVNGTIKAPDPSGEIVLNEGNIEMPQYGIDYTNGNFLISFTADKIKIERLSIASEDGELTANGTANFDSLFYSGKLLQSNIDIKFNSFNPVNHQQYNMMLSGNTTLKGNTEAINIDGDLTIPQAEIYLPAILQLMGQSEPKKGPDPLLIKALNKGDSIAIESIKIPKDTTQSINLLKNVVGSINVEIPKNTWIKDESMRIELSGNIQVVKNPDFFELFGDVTVVRGQYDLFGRTFVIEQGAITFQGGKEMTPYIDLTGKYRFRNAQRVEQTLTVEITGNASEPNIAFNLDGQSINEGDALSYIVFGRSMDELSVDQQENVASSDAKEIATQAAASLLSSQLTKLLGENLNVDYIEVKSGGDFSNATVTVGKYITNDLFVSYEQLFGETNEKDIDQYSVTLEYELFRFLFLQLNNSSSESGFDVIFKLGNK